MALTTSSSSGTAGWLGGCPPGEVDLDVGCVGQRPVADGGMWMQVDGRVGRAVGADQLDRRGTRPGDPTLVASPRRVALRCDTTRPAAFGCGQRVSGLLDGEPQRVDR